MTTRKQQPAIPPAEWAVAALGALIVIFVLAVLVLDAARAGGSPPAISFAVDTIHAGAGGYIVDVRVRNTGGQTAAELVVAGTVQHADGGAEHSQMVLDYLPPRSERHIGLMFQRDPRNARVALRALGYQRP